MPLPTGTVLLTDKGGFFTVFADAEKVGIVAIRAKDFISCKHVRWNVIFISWKLSLLIVLINSDTSSYKSQISIPYLFLTILNQRVSYIICPTILSFSSESFLSHLPFTSSISYKPTSIASKQPSKISPLPLRSSLKKKWLHAMIGRKRSMVA